MREEQYSTVLVAQSCPTIGNPWPVAHQAPLAMGFSRQEYWSGSPCPPPEDLPDPGIKPRFPALQADSLPLSHQGSSHKDILYLIYHSLGTKEDTVVLNMPLRRVIFSRC